MRKYKTTGNTTLFDKEDMERKLTEMGDSLERLSKTVDFEMFRTELEDWHCFMLPVTIPWRL